MENHLCFTQSSRTTAAVKVIRWNDGGIEKFREAIKVGELMVDNPQQFVCDFSGLQAGRRIAALCSEEDLVLGGLYVLLPMQKYLRCVLSPSDMASLNLLAFQCNSAHGKFSRNSRIFPAIGAGHLSEVSSRKGSAEKSDQLQAKLTYRLENDGWTDIPTGGDSVGHPSFEENGFQLRPAQHLCLRCLRNPFSSLPASA